MTNWFRNVKINGYKDILLKAFPQALQNDVKMVLEILPFDKNEVQSFDGKFYKVDNLIHPSSLSVTLKNEHLTIPYRLSINEPDIDKEVHLTDTQKTILNCIYVKHHNGYTRQRRLEVLHDKNEYWTTPFKFQLLGEYVLEILIVLNKQLDEKNIDNFKKFIIENQKYWEQTKSRMISYWNEYYRRPQYPRLNEYVGKKIVDKVEFSFIQDRK